MTSINKSLEQQPSNNFMEDFTMVGKLLQSPGQFFDEIRNNVDLSTKNLSMLTSAIIFLLIYGAILGSGHPLQAISSAIKLPLVFLSGLAACLPALYVFDVLLGSDRSLGQTVAILLAAMTAIAVTLFSLAPITVVFRLTVRGYQFFKLLNVAFMAIAMLVGLFYLEYGVRRTSTESNNQLFSYVLYALWIIVFVFVIGQIAWGARPFFHYPGTPFTLLVRGGNLFSEMNAALGEFLGFWVLR